MTYERWQSLIGDIQDRFSNVTVTKVNLTPGPGSREIVEFTSPAGRVKLELTLRPKILDKKTFYSNRIGSATTVEYEYDEQEKTLSLQAWRFSEPAGEWQEIKTDDLLRVF